MKTSVDEMLRNLIFRSFRVKGISFAFLEGLLALCITGVAFMLRTPFETGLPHWIYLLAEWYLAVNAAALVWSYTASRKKTIGTYALLLTLPTVIADGTILRGNACIGALLLLSALLYLECGNRWMFTLSVAVMLIWSVSYVGILFACIVLWQNRKLKSEQLLLLLAAGGVRFVYSYRLWLQAGYSLTTFHFPNIYEIVGREAVQTQLIDPVSLVGLFLTLGLLVLAVYLFGLGKMTESKTYLLRLFLFFGLAAVYFLPYMNQSAGYLICVLSVVYMMTAPGQFFVPMLLQIAAFAGYQECFNGTSMMPMWVFAVIQFLLLAYLGIRLLQEMGVVRIWSQKN